jgi:riboflavin kinase/FMN adenylyltransferase
MLVHQNLDELPVFNNAVITIGTFDGVHTGHQKVIDALIAESTRVSGESIIITFHPHPRKILNPNTSLHLINTLDEKIRLLSKKEIDHLVVVPFTYEFASLPAENYIKDFLVHKFEPKTIIIGYDHHFGMERKGNFNLLFQEKEKCNYKLIEIPKHLIDEIDISSTGIRTALLESKVEVANKLLGYSFFFEGKVVAGDKLGRTLGFPTANLQYLDDDKIKLGQGVYAVYAEVNKQIRKAMLSIGNRPTLKDSSEKIEVNILDFESDLYETSMIVSVEKYLRAQVKYDTLDHLKEQIERDRRDTLAFLQ